MPKQSLPLPLSLAWQVYVSSWKLLKPNFFMALFFVLIMVFTTLLLNLIRYVGASVDGVVTVLLVSGFLFSCNKWSHQKRVELEDLFVAFFDHSVFRRVLPLGLMVGVSNFLSTQVLSALPWTFALIPQIALQLADLVVILSIGAVLFEGAEVLSAVKRVGVILVYNAKLTCASIALMIGLTLLSVGTFGLGLIVYLPVLMGSLYFWYQAMLQEADLTGQSQLLEVRSH
jgi:hypothetical protein